MGIFDKVNEKIEKQAREELARILPGDEKIEFFYIVKEDYCAITPKRIVFVDKRLLSSKKIVTSIPYSRINFVALKRGGIFSISKEVIISSGGSCLEIETYDIEQAYHIMNTISERLG